jgi:glycosyltransferase involved in cell wall biosynthesis
MVRIDPLMRRTFSDAFLIFVKTKETAEAIPRAFQAKVRRALEIGCDGASDWTPRRDIRPSVEAAGLGILHVGRFVHWKGAAFAIRAFADFIQRGGSGHLTMVGRGAEEKRLRKLAHKLGIADKIRWLGWLAQEDLFALYREHDVFLFPSLHDSSGNVVLEAISYGLPVVCLDLGGPSAILAGEAGIAVSVVDRSEAQVVTDMSEALKTLQNDRVYLANEAQRSLSRARRLTWRNAVQSVYQIV